MLLRMCKDIRSGSMFGNCVDIFGTLAQMAPHVPRGFLNGRSTLVVPNYVVGMTSTAGWPLQDWLPSSSYIVMLAVSFSKLAALEIAKNLS